MMPLHDSREDPPMGTAADGPEKMTVFLASVVGSSLAHGDYLPAYTRDISRGNPIEHALATVAAAIAGGSGFDHS
jgi:hypothetical protein